MSRLTEREIARSLAEREDFEPPAGLLDRIKSEIPPEVAVGTEVAGHRRSATPARQRWLMAASLIAMVGAGLFGLRLWRQTVPLSEPIAESPRAAESRGAAQAPKAETGAGSAFEKQEKDASTELPQLPERLQDEAQDQMATAPAPASPPPPPPSPKEESRLRALGYMAGRRNENVTQPAAVPEPVAGGVEGRVEGGVVGGVVGGVAAGAPAPAAEQIASFDDEITIVTETPVAETRRISASVASGKPAPRDVQGQSAPGRSYVGVFYKSAGTNPFTDTAADRLSTFGLDVDTGSFTVARRYLRDGNLPDPASVRVEEFVNFFDYGDPPPARGDFALKAEGAPFPFAQDANHRMLRLNLRAREVKAEHRRPAVLTFVVDVSGSMKEENRLDLVKKSLSLLLDQLRPTDRVGLVAYSDQARLLLEPTSDREAVRRAIEQLRPEASTNAEAGLLLGYQVASRNFRLNASNRIILCSDGVANVGRTGPRAILGQIEREARRGLELTTLGFGMGNYNDHLMEQLADKGDGRYAYVDTLEEAERVLVEELAGTLQTVAKDAKVQVEFNPAVVKRYRLLGYENRAIADERFRDDRVDAGEVGAGHSVTALYEIELRPGAPREGLIAALHLRYRTPEIGNQSEAVKKLYVSDLARSWEEASPGFRLAVLVARFAEVLKQTPWARGADLREVAQQVQAAANSLPKSLKAGRFSELAELVERAARIETKAAGEKD